MNFFKKIWRETKRLAKQQAIYNPLVSPITSFTKGKTAKQARKALGYTVAGVAVAGTGYALASGAFAAPVAGKGALLASGPKGLAAAGTVTATEAGAAGAGGFLPAAGSSGGFLGGLSNTVGQLAGIAQTVQGFFPGKAPSGGDGGGVTPFLGESQGGGSSGGGGGFSGAMPDAGVGMPGGSEIPTWAIIAAAGVALFLIARK